MPPHLRRTLVALLFALLASWAWHPLFAHGLRAEELALLEALAPLESLASAASFEPLGGHPLAVLASAAFARFGGQDGAVLWRAHNVLVLLLAAWLLGRFTRRLCEPWIGAELARAAGWSTSMLFALHPLSVAALGSLRAAPLLWGLALSFGCAWCFLRGRQLRDPRWIWSAAALAVLAGLSHGAALVLPLWLAGAEYVAGGRRRPGAVKRRSALAVLAAGAACVAVDSVLRSLALGAAYAPPELAGLGAWLSAPVASAATAVERLGMLLLAVNAHVLGAPGFVLAGLAALLTLHPMLGAARAAPRLWGWILAAFAFALVSTELVLGRSRVHPLEWADADSLLASAAVVAAAGAVAITSRSGLPRIVLPPIVAALYCALGYSNSLAYSRAAREVTELRAQLASPDERPLLVDAPRSVDGVRAFEGGPWRCPDADTFAAWLASERSSAARAAGERWMHRDVGAEGGAVWRSSALRAASNVIASEIANGPAAAPAAVTWLREGRSPELAVDPLDYGALLVSFDAPVDRARPLVMAWRTAAVGALAEGGGRCEGVWTELGDAPQASFDLTRDLAWLASGEVRLILSESGWSRIDSAQLTPRLPPPPFESEPARKGEAWVFAPRAAPPATFVARTYVLRVFDLENFTSSSFTADAATPAGLQFEGAEAYVESLRERGAAAIAWALEGRVDEQAVERLRGELTR
jgi:hypothetical protein